MNSVLVRLSFFWLSTLGCSVTRAELDISLASAMDPTGYMAESQIAGSFWRINAGDGTLGGVGFQGDADGSYDYSNRENPNPGPLFGSPIDWFPREANFELGAVSFDESSLTGVGQEVAAISTLDISKFWKADPNRLGTTPGGQPTVVSDISDFAIGLAFFNLPGEISFGTFQGPASVTFTDGLLTSVDFSVGATFTLDLTFFGVGVVDYEGTLSAAGNTIEFQIDQTVTTPFGNSRFIADLTGTIQAVGNYSLPTPTPILVNARPFHRSYPDEPKVDTSVSMLPRGTAAQPIQIGNIISATRGITGVVLDLDSLPSLNNISFEFRMSPQGAFDEEAEPFTAWVSAPPPSSVTLQPSEGLEGSDRVQILWADDVISNRYLYIKIMAAGTTTAELFLGHLLGETSGPKANTFTVAFADITSIRESVGQTVGADFRQDIDKNGTVTFADISAMRANVGAQLPQITVPASP